MICRIGRNGVSIAKNDHVLRVPANLPNSGVLHQDRTVVQEMGQLIAHITAIATSSWTRSILPLEFGLAGQLMWLKALERGVRIHVGS